MIWLRSIRDVASELIGLVTATLYPLDAQVRVTETQEVPMADAPKVVIPVELDFTEARKQLAEFTTREIPDMTVGGVSFVDCNLKGAVSDEEIQAAFSRYSAVPATEGTEAELRPNYHEDTRLVDIVAAMLVKKHAEDSNLPVKPWADEIQPVKASWRRRATRELKEMNR